MAKLVLPVGKRVAELALFSVDALPERAPDAAQVRELEGRALLVRLPSAEDGSDLLHAYVDESVPHALLRYCKVGRAQHGRLRLEGGRLAFGSTATAFAGFIADPGVRADADAPAGDYEVTAYPTEYPEHLVRDAIEATLTKQAVRHLTVPVQIVVTALAFAALAALLKAWLVIALIAAGAGFCLRLYARHPNTARLREQKRAVELEYPTVVVALRRAAQ
jgi:hypothetical protein